jgi:hypothetical protein
MTKEKIQMLIDGLDKKISEETDKVALLRIRADLVKLLNSDEEFEAT